MVEVSQYVDNLGRNPFERWFERIDEVTQARIVIALERLEQGNFSSVKGVGAGVFELRLNFGPGHRVYFGKDGKTLVILLGGGSKKHQQRDIEVAQALWQEYKRRKREAACR